MVAKGQGKFRAGFVEVEGDADTMREALRMLTQTFGRQQAVQYVITQEALEVAKTRGLLPGGEPASEDDAGTQDLEVTPTRQKKSPQAPKPKRLKIVDIDLVSGPKSLEQFFEEKGKPASAAKRYLLIAYWLNEYRNGTPVDDHTIYTCYKHLGLNDLPEDVTSPLRKGLSVQGWYRRDDKGQYSINHIGENEVNKMNG
jgi:hypothetical protein